LRKVIVALVILTIIVSVSTVGCAGGTNSYRLGLKLFGERRYQAAINELDKAIESNPNYPEAWYVKGDCYYNLQRYDDAVAAYEKANWDRVKSHREAIDAAQKALEAHPESAALWRLRGEFYRENGKLAEAMTCYDRALSINPVDYQSWVGKYKSLRAAGRNEEAEQLRIQGQQAGVF
jgi:tetratricopeptide (TPR) repeat protein